MLELVTVIVIVAVLATMLIPAVRSLREKSARLACSANLKNLYVAANAYTIDHESWPQISTKNIHAPAYAESWIAALSPYSLTQVNWVCPTVEEKLGSPIKKDKKHKRLDYFACPFGPGQRTPYKWTTQPWFVERADSHGDGNLMIFADGKIKSLREVTQRR